MKKKALLLTLIFSLALTPIINACSSATENVSSDDASTPPSGTTEDVPTEDVTATSDTETEPESDEPQDFYDMTGLPRDLDLGGYDIVFDVEEGANGNLSERSIWVEEDSGDVVDSAIFERNMNVMESLNCNISLLPVESYSASRDRLRTQTKAGTDDSQIFGLYQYFSTAVASENIVYNLVNLAYNDFSRDYWAVDYMNDLSYKGAYFFATGPIALRYTGGVYVTYVNGNIWNELYADTNIYDIVRDGKWTYDYLSEVVSGAYIDTNGNGTADDTDTFGFIQSVMDMFDGMAVGADVKWSERDDAGNVTITVNNEHNINFYEKLYNLMYNTTGSFIAAADDSITAMQMFNNGLSMVTINKMFQAEIYLREMEDNYIIIPLPKLDEAQAEYNSGIHDGCTLFVIPITAGNPDACGAVLEAMAAESARLVSPAYYDQALKVKYTRDSDSGEMIDLIYSHISTDFVFLYSNNFSDIAHLFRNGIGNKTEALASTMERSSKVWNKSLERFLEKMDAVIEKQG